MRLTLRTLLAYLDDVLPPDQAKEMGQKLTESGYATALVDRIKDVMRRRRLAAPELNGPAVGIEPNVVAEYLDNELAPSNIADVEKICLDSDVHLAEVAACHQILTLVLGEPVDVRPETRARMYALGPVAISDIMKANDGPSSITLGADHQPFPSISTALNPQDTGSIDRTLPDYLKRKTSWRRTGLLVVLLLVAVGWISLVMRDPTLHNGLTSGSRSAVESPRDVSASGANGDAARQEPSGAAALAEDRRLENADKLAMPAAQEEALVAVAENANAKIAAKQPKELPPDDDKLEDAKVGPANRDKPSDNESSKTEAANAGKNNPATAVSEVNAVASKKIEATLLPSLKLLRISKDGILLHYVAAADDFMVLPKEVELKPGDRLVCPEPFRADIVVGDDLCQVALIGGTAVTCLGPRQDASFGFDVQQGSVLFEAKGWPRPVAEADKDDVDRSGLPIAILLRGLHCRLELASDDALCGIEVHRREPNHFEQEPDAPGLSAALHVARGTVRFTDTAGKVTTLEGPGFVPITADVAANLKNIEIGRPSQLILPDWLEADPKRAAAKQKRPYNLTFEKEFDAEQPLLLSVPAIVNNPRPRIAELAVKCLALTDSYAPLVKTLVQAEHPEARLASIAALRQWLPLDPKNRQLLKGELGRHFLPSDADAVYRLLWGFNHDDAKSSAKSQMLVGWLEHEQVAIRELAFWHVQRLTGLRHDYSPINPPGQRRAAVERWRTHLDKKGGALIQE